MTETTLLQQADPHLMLLKSLKWAYAKHSNDLASNCETARTNLMLALKEGDLEKAGDWLAALRGIVEAAPEGLVKHPEDVDTALERLEGLVL